MKTIFMWASPHQITKEQRDSLEDLGQVHLLKDENPELFNEICSSPNNVSDLLDLANKLKKETKSSEGEVDLYIVQPAGSPAFQYALGILEVDVIYAHSERISQDITQPDGSIKKISIFKHEGWIGL